jgi:tetrahydromethanopterin S-methyltransferase subunit G
MENIENDKIIILEQQMKEVCEKIDKLDIKVEKGFADIKNEMNQYVRKDNYQRDMKAISKQDKLHSEEIEKIGSAVNKLIWLLATTVVGFIIMQILESR